MSRKIVQMTVLACALFSVILTTVTPASAQVNVNINIGPPPPVVVHAAPTMLFLPEPAIYVAVGTPYDIFFIDGRYYYFHGDNWFWASGYRGPWVHVVYRSLPLGLRKFKVHHLRQYREREYAVYRVQGPKFKGKHPVGIEDGDSGGGKSQGRGRGKRGKG